MKFHKQEIIDGEINKELLIEKRDKTIKAGDVINLFYTMKKMIDNQDAHWRDCYFFLYDTIKRLDDVGCNMHKIKKIFKSEEIKLFKYIIH